MLAYDDDNLYAAFICVNRNPEKDFVIQSLKRDFSILSNDAIVLTLSPFMDGQNGFSFGVTPRNAQREGAVENGGNFGVTTAWDQIWYSATHISKDTWYAEMEIPFKSIRFTSDSGMWHFNVVRTDYKNNEVSAWVGVPRNLNISTLGFVGHLMWAEPPRKRNANIAIIPYVSNVSTGDKTQLFNQNKPRFGGDAKIALSSALNLDLTVNPDFAQVDVDEQQLNLTQFSLFFPERRQFFIENSDLFANFGFRQIRPFFSRKIGLEGSTIVPIDAGVRVTGKIGNGLRVGAMDVQTREVGIYQPKNYFTLAFQQKVFTYSNIGFILVNDMLAGSKNFGSNRGTVTGLEYNLLTKNNRLVGKAFVQKSFSNLSKDDYSHASFLMYRNIFWSMAWNHEYVGKNFYARTGFVPRTEVRDPVLNQVKRFSYWRLEPDIKRTFYPKNSVINNYSFALYNSSYYDSFFRPTESYTSATGRIVFLNQSEIRVVGADRFQHVFIPFAPIRTNKKYLFGKYRWQEAGIGFSSNNRKKVNGVLDIVVGDFYNGKRFSLTSSLQYRRQPWGVFSLTYRTERINLDTIGSSVLNLIGAKADISFSTTMYFTTFFQYNTQTDNVNVNVRFQWRYNPMSDFFIVYSENYLPDFTTINRSLALKLVYWLNS